MKFNTTEELIEDFRQGKMVILVDDEDRENEGDLVMPAQFVTAPQINFMAKYARGLICMPISSEKCTQLGLKPMTTHNTESHNTKFTVSIDSASGITTGISAADRAKTILDAASDTSTPSDFVQPGHVFPLQAEPGGVLARAGHTEAGCDLALLAGLKPAAVIVEILNDDGSMARRPELEKIAQQHKLKIGTIAELIEHRMRHEKTVMRANQCALPTQFGVFKLFAYRDEVTKSVHFALVKGKIDNAPTLIRVHVEDPLCDLTFSQRDDCGWTIGDGLKRIADEGAGVMVILRHPQNKENLMQRIERYAAQDSGEEVAPITGGEDLRTYGVGAQILLDLGVRKMRILSAPKKIHGISGFGLEVIEYLGA